jgi:ribosome-associated toxin RatA of RatAB toxin-antitoxin module
VDVQVSYEFQNPVYGLLASAAYDKVAKRMIKAFEDRAIVVYGASSLEDIARSTA